MFETVRDFFTNPFNGSSNVLDMSAINQFNYNNLLNEYNSLGAQLTDGMARGLDVTDINNQMDYISSQLTNLEQLAALQNMDPSKMSPLQAMQAQKMIDANTGITGFMNNNFGGWKNTLNAIGQLGNLYMGAKALGLAEDQLDLQNKSVNFNIAKTTSDFANQVKSYNTALQDRMQARAYTETGNKNAYDKQIEERKLDDKI